MKVTTPDAFLSDLFDASPALVATLTNEAHANLTKSAPSWEAYLDILDGGRKLKQFAGRLRAYALSPELTDGDAAAIEALSHQRHEYG